MSENYSYIETTVIVPDNGEALRHEYKWVGDSDECDIPEMVFWEIVGEMRKPIPGEVIHVGELELTYVGEEGLFLYKFTRNRRFAWLKAVHFRLLRWLQLINYRILHTLIVWNLARYEPGAIPTWKDVKIIKKEAKKP